MGNTKVIRRRRRLRKLRRIALGVAGFSFVVWVFYLGATWGPRAIDAPARTASDGGSHELVEESKDLERRFEAIATYREPTEEELDLLQQAFDRQREHNRGGRASSEDRRRQEELEQRLAHFRAKELHGRSVEAEEEAERLLESGEVLAAVEKVQEAYELQRRVNQQFGRGSEFRDAFRETRLQQQVSGMEAAPLHERSVELEEEADEAIEEFRWEDARELLAEARRLQARVNETSRRSSYYSPSRLGELDRKMDSLRVGEMMSEVEELTARGEAHEAESEWEQAAQMYEQAMGLQNRINRDHPQSRFVSRERVVELDTARQTALSTPDGQRLEEVMAKLREDLADQDFERVSEQVESARTISSRLSNRFPRSAFVDSQLRLQLNYLSVADGMLPELQNLLNENLVALPGNPGLKMSRAPVSQSLYLRVMNANPSRHLGEELPVDSVTLRQAREFCRRASWILGRPVALPGKEDFQAALGEWDPESYALLSWHRENSEGSTHGVATGAPNPHGFLHLVGNLRIWLDDAGENGSAWIAGSSYADEFPEEELFQQVSHNKRDATLGFRYLVGE